MSDERHMFGVHREDWLHSVDPVVMRAFMGVLDRIRELERRLDTLEREDESEERGA